MDGRFTRRFLDHPLSERRVARQAGNARRLVREGRPPRRLLGS